MQIKYKLLLIVALNVFINTALTAQAQEDDYPSSTANQNCILLTIEGLRDAYGEGLLFEWNYGDGQKGYGLESDHCYGKSGSYEATLSVIDPRPEVRFADDYAVDVSILPALELDFEIKLMSEGVYSLLANVKNGIINKNSIYWDLNNTYYVGNKVDNVSLKQGDEVRALYSYTQNSEVKYLSKTIKFTKE